MGTTTFLIKIKETLDKNSFKSNESEKQLELAAFSVVTGTPPIK